MSAKPTGATPVTAQPGHPGDVGRRIAQRRSQLGLSREETARRAGMAVEYLEHLESSPATVEAGSLTRLAGALGTSARQLLGGDLDRPPGRAAAAAHPVLKELAASECWAKLAPGGVGRVALTAPEGPVVLPVNYRVLDGTLIFRTAVGGTPASTVGSRVAFEVDQVDEALRTGWSVLVVGAATPFDEPEAIEHLIRRGAPDPWAGGVRDVWVRIKPSTVTGRTISTSDTAPQADREP
ncbi:MULTISPECIES: pyridoxamine 5'-phosphate oxidase family protein [unclassified Kitasatospora]|uniref:helix-turn-helix domain-containing protein n=1 Tax=unclassified Kitasatospora TaxID=2633591 RepID=UPI0033DE12F0